MTTLRLRVPSSCKLAASVRRGGRRAGAALLTGAISRAIYARDEWMGRGSAGNGARRANAESMQTTRTLSIKGALSGGSRGRGGPPRAGPLDAEERILEGRYALLARLGAGGFGVVYRAYDEELAREVALKRIELPRLTARAGGAGALARARQEALAAARLSHPAIAALYEARVEGAALYLISELVEGASLQAHNGERSLPERAIIAIGVALCEALEHAHERGVIHCDVTPANVLVTPAALLTPLQRGARPVAKLTDFGSALIEWRSGLGPTAALAAQEPAAIVGTLAYMAPEQRSGRPCGPPADLYAAALVIYEALSGVNPQLSPDGRPSPPPACAPALRRLRGDLPTALSGALERALAAAPQARGGVAELRSALQEAAERLAGSAGAEASGAPRGSGVRSSAQAVPPSGAPAPTRLLERSRRPAGRMRSLTAGAAQSPPAGAPAPAGERAPAIRTGARFIRRRWWWAAALSAIVLQALLGEDALALLFLAGALPLLALPRRTTLAPALALLAPALGTVGLAGAFPALAGQARGWLDRAAIALLGAWWTITLQPAASGLLWAWPPHPRHPPHLRSDAGATAALRVLRAALVPATAEVLAVWALAAVLLPWLVRGRRPLRDLSAAIVWSALLAGGTGAVLGGAMPRGALLSAAVGVLAAIAGRVLRGPGARSVQCVT